MSQITESGIRKYWRYASLDHRPNTGLVESTIPAEVAAVAPPIRNQR